MGEGGWVEKGESGGGWREWGWVERGESGGGWRGVGMSGVYFCGGILTVLLTWVVFFGG